MKKVLLSIALTVFLATTVIAKPSGPYEVVESDGMYLVSKDDGDTFVGGAYVSKGQAQRKANQLNRQEKKNASVIASDDCDEMIHVNC